jgi:hypothetical protein
MKILLCIFLFFLPAKKVIIYSALTHIAAAADSAATQQALKTRYIREGNPILGVHPGPVRLYLEPQAIVSIFDIMSRRMVAKHPTLVKGTYIFTSILHAGATADSLYLARRYR